MGWRSSWIAVESEDLDGVLADLGWVTTGDREEEHFDPGMVALRRGPWAVLFADGGEYFFRLDAPMARRLSKGRRAVFLYEDDTSMYAEIRGFRDGQEEWAVVHGDGKQAHLIGAVPRGEEIRAGQAALQEGAEDVDYLYDVAPQVGLEVVGFRHDQAAADDGFHPVRRR